MDHNANTWESAGFAHLILVSAKIPTVKLAVNTWEGFHPTCVQYTSVIFNKQWKWINMVVSSVLKCWNTVSCYHVSMLNQQARHKARQWRWKMTQSEDNRWVKRPITHARTHMVNTVQVCEGENAAAIWLNTSHPKKLLASRAAQRPISTLYTNNESEWAQQLFQQLLCRTPKMTNEQKAEKEKEKVAQQNPSVSEKSPSKPVDRMGWLCPGVMTIEGFLCGASSLK